MYKLTINENGKTISSFCGKGAILADVLCDCGVNISRPCGGHGICGKCRVKVNGTEKLACQYVVNEDISVDIITEKMTGNDNNSENVLFDKNDCYVALDIGSTTLVMALAEKTEGRIIRRLVRMNPQRAYGSDVITRIEYCMSNGPRKLQSCITGEINQMLNELLESAGITKIDKMFVSGNSVMLHLFYGEDCSSMGAAPYTPVFLEQRTAEGVSVGIERADTIVSLPCIGSFVGADIVADLICVGNAESGRYNLLVDLGTNSEMVLWSDNKILSTSAAAGPCFEGVNISCGMCAVDGAISSYRSKTSYDVIGNSEPKGLCATGLIDAVKFLVDNGTVDESGCMEEEKYYLTDSVSVTNADVHNFQYAKSAIISGLRILVRTAGITYDEIENFFVTGGFSCSLDIENSVSLGLFPKELKRKFRPIDNACLKGTVLYGKDEKYLWFDAENADYISLALNSDFSEEFISNLMFE